MGSVKQDIGTNTLLFVKKHRLLFALGFFVFFFNFLRINLGVEGLLQESYREFSVDLSVSLLLISIVLFVAILVKKVPYLGTGIRVTMSFLIILIVVHIILAIYYQLESNGGSADVKSELPDTNSIAHPQRTFHWSTSKSPTIPDEQFGFMNRTLDTVYSTIELNGVRKPDVRYVFDEAGRRIHDDFEPLHREKYALFMGCSVTFGMHVKETETLPALFEKLDPEYKSYNYGISSSGTNHYLAMLQNLNLRSQVRERDGIMIYPYFDHHINRSISDFQTFFWNSSSPYYELDGENLVRRGSFETGRPMLNFFFKFLNYSYIDRLINFNYPSTLREKDYKLTAGMIHEMQVEYDRQFGSDKFLVLILPGFGNKIIPYLAEYKIQYLDYSELIPEFWNGDYTFPEDNHPNEKTYRIIAEHLASELKTRF